MKVKQLKKQMDNIKEQCKAGSSLPIDGPSVTDVTIGHYVEENHGSGFGLSTGNVSIGND